VGVPVTGGRGLRVPASRRFQGEMDSGKDCRRKPRQSGRTSNVCRLAATQILAVKADR